MGKYLSDILRQYAKIENDAWIETVTQDSREVKPGALFFALPGLKVDGRTYIQTAIDQGASAIIYHVDRDQNTEIDRIINKQLACRGDRVPIIPVPELRQCYGHIAAQFFDHPSAAIPVVGVTGTNGKTSITHFLAQILRQRVGVIGTLGCGVYPELLPSSLTTADGITLQRYLYELRQQQVDSIVMEVSSHALEQQRVNGVQFNVAIFTQLTHDHLDYHGDMQRYGAAKAKLFQFPGLQHAVINIDDPFGQQLVKQCWPRLQVITCSTKGNRIQSIPAVFARTIEPLSHSQGYHVSITSPWGTGEFVSPLMGRFNVDNLLGVVAASHLLGLPFADSTARIKAVHHVSGRMQVLGGTAQQPVVVVDYAHTPDALGQALQALRERCQGRLWCVFGCGGNRDQAKRPKMAEAALRWSDCIIVTNDNPRDENPKKIAADIMAGFSASTTTTITVLLNRAEAITYAITHASVEDVILVAGKGHEAYQNIRGKLLAFSDQQTVTNALAQRRITN